MTKTALKDRCDWMNVEVSPAFDALVREKGWTYGVHISKRHGDGDVMICFSRNDGVDENLRLSTSLFVSDRRGEFAIRWAIYEEIPEGVGALWSQAEDKLSGGQIASAEIRGPDAVDAQVAVLRAQLKALLSERRAARRVGKLMEQPREIATA